MLLGGQRCNLKAQQLMEKLLQKAPNVTLRASMDRNVELQQIAEAHLASCIIMIQ